MNNTARDTIKKLRDGETVNLEGILLERDDGEIQPGDLYVAQRNSGPKLLTCLRVNNYDGWIVPVDRAYCYDINECVKVREKE